jgi:hypothetical protein
MPTGNTVGFFSSRENVMGGYEAGDIFLYHNIQLVELETKSRSLQRF